MNTNTTTANAAAIRHAIARSISHTEIVEVEVEGGLEAALSSIAGDYDWTETNDPTLFDVWSLDEDHLGASTWRINIRIS